MQAKYFFVIVLLVVYLYVTIKAIFSIYKTLKLSKKQKWVNYFGVVLVPFIWAVYLKGAIKITPGYCDAPYEVPISATSTPKYPGAN